MLTVRCDALVCDYYPNFSCEDVQIIDLEIEKQYDFIDMRTMPAFLDYIKSGVLAIGVSSL